MVMQSQSRCNAPNYTRLGASLATSPSSTIHRHIPIAFLFVGCLIMFIFTLASNVPKITLDHQMETTLNHVRGTRAVIHHHEYHPATTPRLPKPQCSDLAKCSQPRAQEEIQSEPNPTTTLFRTAG